eukprot:11439783-Ditylum_brightwellii.AAC.1
MFQLGFMPSKADSDIWMKDFKDHWEYVCTWVDDLLYAGHDGKLFYDALRELKYQLKGGAQTYMKRMLASHEQLFGEPMPKQEVHAPLEP